MRRRNAVPARARSARRRPRARIGNRRDDPGGRIRPRAESRDAFRARGPDRRDLASTSVREIVPPSAIQPSSISARMRSNHISVSSREKMMAVSLHAGRPIGPTRPIPGLLIAAEPQDRPRPRGRASRRARSGGRRAPAPCETGPTAAASRARRARRAAGSSARRGDADRRSQHRRTQSENDAEQRDRHGEHMGVEHQPPGAAAARPAAAALVKAVARPIIHDEVEDRQQADGDPEPAAGRRRRRMRDRSTRKQRRARAPNATSAPNALEFDEPGQREQRENEFATPALPATARRRRRAKPAAAASASSQPARQGCACTTSSSG